MMNLRLIELEEQNIYVLFFPDNLRFFKINKYTKKIVKAYLEGKSLEDIKGKFHINSNELEKLFNTIKKINKQKLAPMKGIEYFNNKLEKLVIAVTDKCNLKCKYCYEAMQENFIKKKSLKKKDIDRIFHVITQKYDEIALIQIFGGEALLEYELIEYIALKVRQLYDTNILKIMPDIGLITNGTILNDKIINIFKKYNIKFTVSFDGNKTCNDKCRVFKEGNGSSEIILKNIKKLRSNNIFPSGIEATYNKTHKQSNSKIIDMLCFIRDECGTNNFHISPVIAEMDSPLYADDLSEFVDSIDDMFAQEGNKVLTSLVGRFVQALMNKRQIDYLCGAGITDLSVSPEGNIYPCFMLFGEDNYKMGNIYDDNVFESDLFKKVKGQYVEGVKNSIEECQKCYIKNLCHGCLGVNYIKNNSAFIPDKNSCDLYRAMADRVIINLVKEKDKRVCLKRVRGKLDV